VAAFGVDAGGEEELDAELRVLGGLTPGAPAVACAP
jgi:hypothetical protein